MAHRGELPGEDRASQNDQLDELASSPHLMDDWSTALASNDWHACLRILDRARKPGLVDPSAPSDHTPEEGRRTTASREIRNARRSRAGWLGIDQIASSIGNVIVAIAIARESSDVEFGAFTTAYLVYLIAQALVRTLSGEVLLVRYSQVATVASAEQLQRIRDCRVANVVAASSFALIAGSAAFLTRQSALGVMLAATSIGLVGMLFQDLLRYEDMTHGRPRRTAMNNATWLVLEVAGIGALYAFDLASPQTIYWVWVLSACVTAVVFFRRVPARRGSWTRWFASTRDLSVRYFGETVIDRASTQGALLAVGATAGLTVQGALNGARLMFGPLNVVFITAGSILLVEGSFLRGSHRRQLRRAVLMVSGGLVAMTIAVTFALTTIPDRLGAELLGEVWRESAALLVPTGLFASAMAVTLTAQAGLRARGDARRAFRARLVTSPLYVAIVMIASLRGDAVVLAWAFGVAAGIGAVWLIGEFLLETKVEPTS